MGEVEKRRSLREEESFDLGEKIGRDEGEETMVAVEVRVSISAPMSGSLVMVLVFGTGLE